MNETPPPALPELKKKEVKDDIPQVKNEKYAIANVEKIRESYEFHKKIIDIHTIT